jgi:hypothetical protein
MTDTSRFDMYRLIHKALRAMMGTTLATVGRMDPNDDEDTAAALSQVRDLLTLCRSHLECENRFIHPALEARRPGANTRTALDHAQQDGTLGALAEQTETIAAAHGPERAQAAGRLYRALALFVAENLEHMEREEGENNPQLWAAYTDAELASLQDALLASIPPRERALALRWIAPSASPFERAVWLGELQRRAPADAFSTLLETVRSQLTARDWDKVMHALAPLPAAA